MFCQDAGLSNPEEAVGLTDFDLPWGESLAQAYGAEKDRDGFFQEADSKWRPVEALKAGVFGCGSGTTAVEGEAAASRVAVVSATAVAAIVLTEGAGDGVNATTLPAPRPRLAITL